MFGRFLGGMHVGGPWRLAAPNIVTLSVQSMVVGVGTDAPAANVKMHLLAAAAGTETPLYLQAPAGQTAPFISCVSNVPAFLFRVLAGGQVAFGTDPGSGATACASVGTIRAQNAITIIAARNAADDADLNVLRTIGNTLIVGNVDQGNTSVYGVAGIDLVPAGTTAMQLEATFIQMSRPLFRFQSAVVTPTFYQYTDVTAGIVGDLFTIHSQDVNSAGAASTAGALFLRAGDGLGAADLGANLTMRPGAGAGGNGSLTLQEASGVGRFNIGNTGITYAHFAAAGYLRMGLLAGSGAGSAASVGTIRLPTNGTIVGRHGNDAAIDYAMLDINNGGWGWVSVGIGAAGSEAVGVRLAGGEAVQINAPVLRFNVPVVAPSINQLPDPAASAVCDNLAIRAQGASNAVGGASAGTSGSLLLGGGLGTVHADNLDGNVAIGNLPASWQSMELGIFIAQATTAPGAAPAAGVFLWYDGLNLVARTPTSGPVILA